MLLLLVAVVWGVTSMSGAILGGLFLMYLPVAQSEHPGIAGLLFALLGFGAVALGRDPNGLVNKVFGFNRWVTERLYPALAQRFPGLALESRLVEEVQPDVAVVG